MNDDCQIEEVILQENGIIRDKTGMFIGRIVEDTNAFAEKHYQRGYEAGLYKAEKLIRDFKEKEEVDRFRKAQSND